MGTDMTDRVGSRIGPYDVQEHLGSGPLGPAYRAYDARRSHSVVVKLLPGLAAEGRKRFATEVGRLAGISHPNALEVVDHGEHEGIPYLVTTYVPGGSLAGALGRQPPNREAALQVLAGTADFVDYLHGEGVVHGDLKPANVLVGAGGNAFVTDFGLASLLQQPPQGAATEAAPGAVRAEMPVYAAPERLSHGEVTPATDRYTFAAIAFEVLTGTPPFTGLTEGEMASGRLDAPQPAASSPGPALSPAVDAVFERALARDPGKRWPSCGQMVAALEHAIVDDEARAGATEPGPVRSPRWLLVAAIVAAMVAAIVAVVLLSRSSETATVGVTLSDGAVPAGGTVVVLGDHLKPHQAGTIELHGQATPMAAFEADRSGTMAARVAVPSDVRSGSHLVELCWRGSCHASAKLTVTASPTPVVASPTPLGAAHTAAP
jgi:serine/threonine-protein kinase